MAKPVSINISNETIEQVTNEINGRTAIELKNSAETQNIYMKKIALDFIQEAQKSLDQIHALEEYAQTLANKRHSLLPKGQTVSESAQEEYIQFKEDLTAKLNYNMNLNHFFQACLIFNDRILSLITGKDTMVTIIIPQANGEPPIIAEYSLEDLLDPRNGITIVTDFTSRSYRVTGKLQYDLEQIKAYTNKAVHMDNLKSINGLNELNQTYDSARTTYDNYSPYVFWRPTSAKYWFKMKVIGGQGDLAEAYAAMHYLNQESFANRHLYDNLDVFYREGVANVDSVSGLYASDVTGDDLAYNIAIKSLKASLPGYQQMITLARNILNGKVASVEQLKKISEKRQWKDEAHKVHKGIRNHIIETCSTSLQDVYKTTLSLT